jgi:hypothetical protein
MFMSTAREAAMDQRCLLRSLQVNLSTLDQQVQNNGADDNSSLHFRRENLWRLASPFHSQQAMLRAPILPCSERLNRSGYLDMHY